MYYSGITISRSLSSTSLKFKLSAMEGGGTSFWSHIEEYLDILKNNITFVPVYVSNLNMHIAYDLDECIKTCTYMGRMFTTAFQ